MTNHIGSGQKGISAERLALLGGGKIAYIKTVSCEEAQRQFPEAPQLAPGTLLYALHAADGTPILLTRATAMTYPSVGNGDLTGLAR